MDVPDVIAIGGLVFMFFGLIYTYSQLSDQIKFNKEQIKAINRQNDLLGEELALLKKQHEQDTGDLVVTDVRFNREGNWGTNFQIAWVNRGRRPVTIIDVALRTIDGKQIGGISQPRESAFNFQPIELHETNQFEVEISVDCLTTPSPDNVAYVEATLSTNKAIRHDIPESIISAVKKFCEEKTRR